jgi:hypothetical protein
LASNLGEKIEKTCKKEEEPTSAWWFGINFYFLIWMKKNYPKIKFYF